MKNKSTIIISIILFAVLFLAFVFPRLEFFGGIPAIVQTVFRVLIFIGVLSYLIFLIQELFHWQKRCDLAEKTLDSRRSSANREVESGGELSLKLDIDPDRNYNEITAQILKLAQASLMARSAFLYLFNANEHTYTLQAYQSQEGIEFCPNFKAGGTIFREFHLTLKPQIFAADSLEEGSLIYYKKPPKVGTVIVVPILINKEIFVGVLGLDSIDRDAWGHEDIDLVKLFAELFSSSIWQIDAIDRQNTQIAFFKDLCRLNTELPIGIEGLDLYKEASQVLHKFFSFEKLTFAIIREEESSELYIEYVEGYDTDYSIGHRISWKGGLWEKIIKNGEILLLNDYEQEKLQFRFQPGDLNILPFRSCLGVPLEVGRKCLGGILMESYQPSNYLQEEGETLALFAKNLSEIINRTNTYHTMKDLAMIDGLTGLYNHRAFKERLQIEIERSRRYENSLTLMILDLDKFKRINDTYGHIFGDLVLKKTASIIRGSVRTVDTVARYGGEEFAVILINTDKNSSYKTAERIRSNIQSFVFEKNGIREHMTISIGMAEYPADGTDVPNMISNADIAMYQSKRLGGNKVTLFKKEFEN
ncbi:MAG TPA: diguanylate cyclase [Candidatus Marinimicrobia bacterium]|mgnify:CR=1 FL=1|nr:diguanylate cyclase [Candidatus Neomarinimicrobiota bacterium]HRS51056.1 diguanylate cyclase [Candidatus Neomarinimicrobiota bacterium]HRU92563.1 diguanylate cyclase [Candidatus Neomarinimicrobiota bacterium]